MTVIDNIESLTLYRLWRDDSSYLLHLAFDRRLSESELIAFTDYVRNFQGEPAGYESGKSGEPNG
jgi:hypothetical protein